MTNLDFIIVSGIWLAEVSSQTLDGDGIETDMKEDGMEPLNFKDEEKDKPSSNEGLDLPF